LTAPNPPARIPAEPRARRFEGQVAFITGAARGQGRAEAAAGVRRPGRAGRLRRPAPSAPISMARARPVQFRNFVYIERAYLGAAMDVQ
jgi:NAD(P)-dependent dehydrogenase (short-subunit alcohol dehydrogenase family)